MKTNQVFLCAVFLSLLLFASFGLSTANAFWFTGGEVFDAKRFAQSVETTVQATKKAMQTLEMFNKRLTALLSSLQLTSIQNIINAVKNAENQLISDLKGPMNTGKTAVNPIPGQASATGAWKELVFPSESNLAAAPLVSQLGKMQNEQENANYDAWNVVRKNNENLNQLGTELTRAMTTEEEGNLGIRQNSNAARVILIKMMINNMYADAGADIATQTKTKALMVDEDIVFRRNLQMRVGSYDPYKRTTQDNVLYPATSAIGFPKVTP